MVLVQKWPFFHLFFLGITGQENVFDDILEPKNAFLSYKNKKFKKSNNWHFSNFFSLGNKSEANVFNDILVRTNAFLSFENN